MNIADNLARVRQRIAAAAQAAGRDAAAVRLLVVSKTFDAAAVAAAHAAGQRAFGENYVQEALDKMTALGALRQELEWHFIGPLQSNKTRVVAEHFDWVHSVERLKIAQRLSDQRPAGLPPLNVCIQVNISGEDSKSGVALNDAAELVRAVSVLPGLRVRGLMAIPAPAATLEAQRAPYRVLAGLYERLRAENEVGDVTTVGASGASGASSAPDSSSAPLTAEVDATPPDFDTLSIGMSDDLEAAILEGATLVRIGTAVFGARQYADITKTDNT